MRQEVVIAKRAIRAHRAPVVIDLRSIGDQERLDAAVAFWKRALARWYSRRGQPADMRSLFGPYTDAEGFEERGTRLSYDTGKAPGGSLIASFGRPRWLTRKATSSWTTGSSRSSLAR